MRFYEELICFEFVWQCLNVVTFERGGKRGQDVFYSHEVVLQGEWVEDSTNGQADQRGTGLTWKH